MLMLSPHTQSGQNGKPKANYHWQGTAPRVRFQARNYFKALEAEIHYDGSDGNETVGIDVERLACAVHACIIHAKSDNARMATC